MRHPVLLKAILVCGVLAPGCVLDGGGEDLGITQQEVTVNDTLPTSGTKTVSVAVNPGSPSYIIMSSPSSGNWKFETYGSPISLGGCSTGDFVVYTYWRDTSVSSTWTYWPGGGLVCYPTSGWSTNLYSGSSSIQYEFEYDAYGGYGETVYAKFTKL